MLSRTCEPPLQSHAWLQKLVSKYLWGQNTLTLLDPPKNSLRSTLAHLTSLQDLTLTPSPIHLPDHLCTIHSVFHVSQLELATTLKPNSETIPNLLHPWLKSTMSLNMKYLKSSTPKLTTEGDASSYTLSVGQGMKVTDEENLLVTSKPNLIMHKNMLPISILITPGKPRPLQN